MKDLRDERLKKFKSVIARKQLDLTVVLENVHDPHNVGAVLRTCDAVGIHEIYLLYTDTNIDTSPFKIGKSSSTGVDKWIQKHFFTDSDSCFSSVKLKYQNVLGTHLASKSQSLYELDLNQSIALVFGNEKDGLSHEALGHCTGNFIIPQHGMVQSLNISVACAVCLYEASRQRLLKAKYILDFDDQNKLHQNLLDLYMEKHHQKRMRKMKTRMTQD